MIVDTSLERLIERVLEGKNGLESKGLCVIMSKTKIMVSDRYRDVLHDSCIHSCAAGRKGVDAASILCTKFNLWAHWKCSDLDKIKYIPENTFHPCR